ncbi:60 kDa SS-A/Ro ribonucleoprotein-like [Harmonia axyridis]|uniref:60 kDa SS-A/Ro ribonucleoprotein-like n=1 Tax=Harmonia axyridis TaxID=115357 RepID=UPI001E276F89|nr:60 kDa SS-A/Ro ribonucleoprotein-like [Harmonia axyridis]XP_045461386.1 60 kDa SS-A/Ro ribonucleoprotein-like [Harmonia axyridis]
MPRSNKTKKKNTSKTAQTPDKPQISSQNVETDLELKKLKRVIYLTELTPRFIAGNPELYFLKNFAVNLTFIGNLLTKAENIPTFLDILKKANNDVNLPRRVTLFYVLAYALRNHIPENKSTNQLADCVLDICKTNEEFFKFISIFAMMKGKERDLKPEETYNKITTSIGRIIRKFLEKKTPSEYANEVGSANGYYGWQYKDLIKMSHYKSETAEKLIVTDYVLHGFKGMKKPEVGNTDIYETLKKWNSLQDPEISIEKLCDLIKELNASYRNMNPKHIKVQEVWGTIIPQLSIEELLHLLPKFLKYNMFEPMETSIVYAKVKEMLTVANIGFRKVNALELFIHWRNLLKGGKPIDPKLEYYLKTNKLPIKTPSPIPEDNEISKVLQQCMHYSYPLDPTVLGSDSNVVLVLDIAEYGGNCFKQRNITCLEAEVALATYFCRTERSMEVKVFNEHQLEDLDLNNGPDAYSQNLKKLKEIKPSKIKPADVFDWAIAQEREVDVFIFVLQSVKSLPINPKDFRKMFKEAFQDYLKRTDEEVKIIVICLGSHSLAPFGESMNCLTICGFCPELPKVIRSFVKGDIGPIKNKRKPKKD